MLINLITKFRLNLIYIFLIFLINTTLVFSEILNDFKITGNQRLAKETIVMFSELDKGKIINQNILNNSIKNLYSTNYFKKVEMKFDDNVLEIIVEENPIIQTIKLEGIKNNEILNSLREVTKKNEKYPFLVNKIKDQKNLLINSLRNSGFYFVKINTKVINNKNNSVDIIYIFDLGERAIIKKIN